ncbi:hypothetical protein L596_026106 [Steinernema carpocapsae]|uniref:Uncharacterized protein n=1 Tax=Steinernema carpocapsae TaxID=34508 RepID=A0A4U5M0G9_STECR|nr:hypothetical protein L596_026106 [Steinernema carpocapsae]
MSDGEREAAPNPPLARHSRGKHQRRQAMKPGSTTVGSDLAVFLGDLTIRDRPPQAAHDSTHRQGVMDVSMPL